MFFVKAYLVSHKKVLNFTNFLYSLKLDFKKYFLLLLNELHLELCHLLNKDCNFQFKTNNNIRGHHLTLSSWTGEV